MQQQQNKYSSKNYKRNRKPAKLISNEYAIISDAGELKANFTTQKDVKEFLEKQNEKMIVYNIKVYKLNEKNITTTTKL